VLHSNNVMRLYSNNDQYNCNDNNHGHDKCNDSSKVKKIVTSIVMIRMILIMLNDSDVKQEP